MHGCPHLEEGCTLHLVYETEFPTFWQQTPTLEDRQHSLPPPKAESAPLEFSASLRHPRSYRARKWGGSPRNLTAYQAEEEGALGTPTLSGYFQLPFELFPNYTC
jgi:hypothetical protein